jgi:hypothetical protein
MVVFKFFKTIKSFDFLGSSIFLAKDLFNDSTAKTHTKFAMRMIIHKTEDGTSANIERENDAHG